MYLGLMAEKVSLANNLFPKQISNSDIPIFLPALPPSLQIKTAFLRAVLNFNSS